MTPVLTVAFDANGNTLTDAQGRSVTWDFENRLTQVVNPSVGTTTFKYNPFGRRIQKSSPSSTTNYLYDGDNIVETVDATGGEVDGYAQNLNIDAPMAMRRTDTVDYYEADGLGSITTLTAPNGTIAQSYTDDSFGNPMNSSGELINSFRYTGREFDSETSLYFYRARYYDQVTGKFLSEDRARFAAGTNFYQYAVNNPLLFVDWSGNCPIDLNEFVRWLDNHAKPNSTGFCARYIRLALENAGANTQGAPIPAKDWGPFLTNNMGFSPLAHDPAYSPQVGDTAVFQPANGSNPAGHIEVWDGTQWVSDYKQGPPLPDGTHFYPNLGKYGPQPYVVYRCN
jgi:RHS repeat-associated protein